MMFHRRKQSPEWQAITSAQARHLSAERAARAAARQALIDATHHLEVDEAFDLLLAQYANHVPPALLHLVMQRHERATDALKTETERLDAAANIARAMGN